jgi:hypothetical protein
VRFFSSQQPKVSSRHLENVLIGEATSEKMKEGLHKTMNNAGLYLKQMITLSSDGPYVNKKVFKLIDELKNQDIGKCLLDIGTCNLHVVNTVSHKGLQVFGDDIAGLVIQLYYFFN